MTTLVVELVVKSAVVVATWVIEVVELVRDECARNVGGGDGSYVGG